MGLYGSFKGNWSFFSVFQLVGPSLLMDVWEEDVHGRNPPQTHQLRERLV